MVILKEQLNRDPVVSNKAYMDPAQCDEVVLVLSIKQFLLVNSLARVRLTLLFGHNDVCYSEHIAGL